jgi:hypothetical protein
MEQHPQSRFLAPRTLRGMTAKGKGAACWEWRSRGRVRQAGEKDSSVTNRTLNNEGRGTLEKNTRPKTVPEAGRGPLNQQAQNRFLAMPAHHGGHAAGGLGPATPSWMEQTQMAMG